MVNNQLVSYIKEQINNGYNIDAIKHNLIQHGYDPHSVEEASRQLYNQDKGTHSVIIPAAVIGIALLVLFIGFMFLRTPVVPNELLDIETVSLKDEVSPGEILNFNVELVNMGTSNAYDVVLKHSLLDLRGAVITSKQESVAILTKASSKSQMQIPKSIASGRYILETTAYYHDKTAKSSFMIEVSRPENQSNSVTGNAVSVPLNECPVNCDDMNPCTLDICTPGDEFICKHSVIEPCCGNDECESSENYKVCSKDCEKPDIYKSLSREEIIDTAKDKASDSPDDAVTFCKDIKDNNARDECYRAIADKTRDNEYCDIINSDVRRDMCYGDFASRGDTSVCSKITNPYMKESCESLK